MGDRTIRHLSAVLLWAGILLATGATPAPAQLLQSPRSTGMAGAYLGTARGQEALFLNPANLGLSGGPAWSIALAQASVSGSVVGPRLEDLPALLAPAEGGQERRDQLLATIPQSGTEARVDVRAPLFGLQVGPFAVGIGYGAVGEHSVGRDVVELLTRGYEDGRTDYSVGNTAGSRLTYWDVAAGYGQRVGPLSLGLTGRYIRGGSAVRGRMFEPAIDVEAGDFELNYVTVASRGGSGYALDLGAAYQPGAGFTLSAAVSNALSRMQWSEQLRVRDFRVRGSELESLDPVELAMRFDASETDLDPSAVSARVYQTAERLFEEAYFPAVARAGVDWSLGWTRVGAAYQRNLTDGRMAGRWAQVASVGLQQKLPLLTLQGGFATDLEQGRLLSGGLSLGALQLGVARVSDGLEDGSPRSGWMGSLGLSVAAGRR